jgi:hypothetical protein
MNSYQKTQNYQKVKQVIEAAGLPYKKNPHELKEERWFETVSNPQTGDFFQ